MKPIFTLGLISLTIFSCSSSADLNTTFSVKAKINQVEQVTGDLTIEVKNVNDSRCPEGCECIWAGEVVVFFKISNSQSSIDTSLILPRRPKMQFRNWSIELVSVNPYPICNYNFPGTSTINFKVDNINKETLLVQGSSR